MNKIFAESLAVSTTFLLIALFLYTMIDFTPPRTVYEVEDGYYTIFYVAPSLGTEKTKYFKVEGQNWLIHCDIQSYSKYSNITIYLFKEGSEEPSLTLGFFPKTGVLERLSGVQMKPTKSNLWLLFVKNLFQPDLPPGTYYLKIQWNEIKYKIKILEV